MCDDVITNHVHVGMSRDEVIALLGAPVDDAPGLLAWDARGLGFYFNVILDEDGRVTRSFLESY